MSVPARQSVPVFYHGPTLGFRIPDPWFTAMNVATNTGFQCSCQGWFTINKGSAFFKTDYATAMPKEGADRHAKQVTVHAKSCEVQENQCSKFSRTGCTKQEAWWLIMSCYCQQSPSVKPLIACNHLDPHELHEGTTIQLFDTLHLLHATFCARERVCDRGNGITVKIQPP